MLIFSIIHTIINKVNVLKLIVVFCTRHLYSCVIGSILSYTGAINGLLIPLACLYRTTLTTEAHKTKQNIEMVNDHHHDDNNGDETVEHIGRKRPKRLGVGGTSNI